MPADAVRSLGLALCLVLVVRLGQATRQDCYGAWVELTVNETAEGSPLPSPLRIYGYPGDIGRPLHIGSPVGPFALSQASPPSACGSVEAPPSTGPRGRRDAALVRRGDCSFLDKARAVAAAGYAAMILVDSAPRGCTVMGSNDTAAAHGVDLVVATITAAAGERLESAIAAAPAVATPAMWISIPDPNAYGRDWAPAALWIAAVCCVTLACVLAARTQRAALDQSADAGRQTAPERVEISRGAAALFIVIASASLLALYWLHGDWVVAALCAVFALAAWQPLAEAIRAGLEAIGTATFAARRRRVPPSDAPRPAPVTRLSTERNALLDSLASAAACAVCLLWFVCRDQTRWSWAPQDALALCLLVALLRSCLLPDLATAAVLLPLAFAYDIWWVFLQPAVTGSPSVMVEVAAGGNDGPRLPMVLLAPTPGPGDNPAMAVLGLGDVALPGLLLAFLARWDATGVAKRLPGDAPAPGRPWGRGYAFPGVLGFAGGLALTYLALAHSWFGDAGQPALLHLVPCTLGTTCLLALWRGELRALWHADIEPDSDRGDKTSDEEPDAPGPRATLLEPA